MEQNLVRVNNHLQTYQKVGTTTEEYRRSELHTFLSQKDINLGNAFEHPSFFFNHKYAVPLYVVQQSFKNSLEVYAYRKINGIEVVTFVKVIGYPFYAPIFHGEKKIGIDQKHHEMVRQRMRQALVDFFRTQIVNHVPREYIKTYDSKSGFKPYHVWSRPLDGNDIIFFYVDGDDMINIQDDEVNCENESKQMNII